VYSTNDLEPLDFDVELIVDALKSQDKALVESFEYFFTTLFGPKYTTDILTVAVFQLAETDLDACRWALHNFYDLKLHHEIIEGIVMFAAQKLIDKGFILGQEFSINKTGEIVLTESAKAVLMANTLYSDHIFIEEILQVI
jgi:hypothetical protein